MPEKETPGKNTGHRWRDMHKDYPLLADWFDEHLGPTVAKHESDLLNNPIDLADLFDL